MKAMKLFVTGLILLAACSSQACARGNGITQEFHQSYPLSSGGKVRLNNINGGVEIRVWDKNEVKVDAVKHADDEAMMDQLQIEVNPSSGLVDIDTKYPDNTNTHNEEGPWVEYTLTVPKEANLDKIKTINGNIEISGIAGELNATTVNGAVDASGITEDCRLETVNGNVKAEFALLKSGSKAKLKAVNGSITIDIPTSVGAAVKARTVSGHITNDFGLASSRDERAVVKVGDSVDGQIGDGKASLELETVNGNIRILKPGDGK